MGAIQLAELLLEVVALAIRLLSGRLQIRFDQLVLLLRGGQGRHGVGAGLLGLRQAPGDGLFFPGQVVEPSGVCLFAVAQPASALSLGIERGLEFLDSRGGIGESLLQLVPFGRDCFDLVFGFCETVRERGVVFSQLADGLIPPFMKLIEFIEFALELLDFLAGHSREAFVIASGFIEQPLAVC